MLIFFQMAALRNKRKLAAVNKESKEEHPWKNLLRDSNPH